MTGYTVKLPTGLKVRGHSIQAKASVTIEENGKKKELRPTKSFPFVDEKTSNKEDNFIEAKEKAYMWKKETEDALRLGKELIIPQKKEMTLEEGADFTYNMKWSSNKNPETPLTNVKILTKFFGAKVKLKDIDGAEMIKFVQHRIAQGKADGTINRQLTALSTIMKCCFADGKFSADGRVPPKLPLRKEYEQRIRYWSIEEEQIFRAECEQRGDSYILVGDAVLLSLRGGLRQGEVLALEVRDIWDEPEAMDGQGVMHITLPAPMTKSSKTRNVTIMGACRQMMLNRIAGLNQTDRPFAELSKDMLQHRFNTIKGHMGLGRDEGFIFHACRHTCLTRLSERGMQPRAIQIWAGHSDLKTTQRYIHPSKLAMELGGSMMASYDVTPSEPNKLSLVR